MDFLNESKKYEESFLSDLRDIIRIPSLRNDAEACEGAPFGKGCREALDWMLKKGEAEGFKVKDYNGYAGVIEYGEGEESVGILGHLDIVPVGEGWTKDPFGCEVHDGYVFGRGVLDDKGPTLCAFYALKMIKDLNVKLNKKIIMIVGCDEESGMQCMEYYCKHGEIPTCGFVPDADFPLIYGEKGILGFTLSTKRKTVIKSMNAGERSNIVIGKASLTLADLSDEQEKLFKYYLDVHHLQGEVVRGDDVELMIEGKYMHSAMCYDGINAALHLLNFVGETFNDEVAKQLYDLLGNWNGTGLGIAMNGAYMGFLTMNTGIIHIDENECCATIDIRYPNDTDSETLMATVAQTLKDKDFDFEVGNVKNSNPLFVDPKSELIQVLEASYRKYSEDDFTPLQTIGGGTYARKFDNFVAFGPEFPIREKTSFFVGGPHEKDEGMPLDYLMKAMAIYADAIEKLGK